MTPEQREELINRRIGLYTTLGLIAATPVVLCVWFALVGWMATAWHWMLHALVG